MRTNGSYLKLQTPASIVFSVEELELFGRDAEPDQSLRKVSQAVGCKAAKWRDGPNSEIPLIHSITSSVLASSIGGKTKRLGSLEIERRLEFAGAAGHSFSHTYAHLLQRRQLCEGRSFDCRAPGSKLDTREPEEFFE